jgi:hypothetical protein
VGGLAGVDPVVAVRATTAKDRFGQFPTLESTRSNSSRVLAPSAKLARFCLHRVATEDSRRRMSGQTRWANNKRKDALRYRNAPNFKSNALDQAATEAFRRRATTPTMPKPTIISAQLAGSGTALRTGSLTE